MDYGLSGKRVLVTAGAHGIGEACADLFSKEGARVFVVDVDAAAIAEKRNRWAGASVADLASSDGVSKAIEAMQVCFGSVPDVVVNNVGVADQQSFVNLSDELWQRSHELNLMACVRFCRSLLPEMSKKPGGSIINVSSDLAKQPEPMPMEYGVAKAGLLYVTKALAKEYAPNVRVNAVCPGPIWTRLWSRPGGVVDQLAVQYGLDRDAALAKHLEDRYLPLGMGEADDVAQAIVFLASSSAKRSTGLALDVGGTVRGIL
jgi:NAD(P)-dependent dehydrogenase (short-subunit alcohol dehydrogenase family)